MITPSSMVAHVNAYLDERRRLGYQLRIEGQQLLKFARFADECGYGDKLTIELALAWANSSRTASPLGKARRLEVVRSFAKFRFIEDPGTEIPPAGLLGPAHRRVSPYIYSGQQINDLIEAASQLEPVGGLRPASLKTLYALLACTGMRISEAVKLSRDDVDWPKGALTVRETKFHKSRILPLHHSTLAALREYSTLRDNYAFLVKTSAFFLFDDGTPLNYEKAHYAFKCLRNKLRWTQANHGRLPRIYDLRHTFVCRRLLAWYEKGVDIDRMIPYLSTYLGHVKVSDTYWYITAIPELMAVAAKRFEHFTQQSLGEHL